MVFPLLPFYAQEFGATATGIGILAAAFPLGQIFVAPVVGKLSDRIGRKPVLFAALVGSAFSFFLFGVAQSFEMLVASRMLHGAFTAGSFPIASAYIADSTKEATRAKYMGRLTAMFALGIMVGPGVAGLLSIFGSSIPFFVAAIVSLFASLFVYFFLPESLSLSARVHEKIRPRTFVSVFPRLIRGARGNMNVLFFSIFAWAFAISNFQVAFPLFTEASFGFTSTDIGVVFSFIGIVSAVAQFIVLPFLVARYTEYKTAVAAALFMGIGQVLIPYSSTWGMLVAFTGFSVFGGSMIRPLINTILSEETQEGQGATMGIAFSFTSLGRIIGPVIAGALIAYINLASQFLVTGLILFSSALFLILRYNLFGIKRYIKSWEHLKDKQNPLG